MNSASTLAKQLNMKEELDSPALDCHKLIQAASKVIVPLGPIQTFAARHPWMGLEQESFAQVARRFKETCDVDIYPNESVFRSAWKHGEIDPYFLEIGLQHWLDSHSLELPRETAEQFCRTALMLDQPTTSLSEVPELKKLVKRLSRFKSQTTEKYFVQTYSQRLDTMGIGTGNSVEELNRHMIKWCKLFLDDSQAVWSIPNREKGFYETWRRLVQYDPALSNTLRKQLRHLPKDADDALKDALVRLKVPYAEMQHYLEAHLLALPGWAGMMLWRSQQAAQENSVLTEYLAVRIFMEWILIKQHLPLPENRMEDNVQLEPLIASCIQCSDLPIDAWSQLSYTELKARVTLAFRFDQNVRARLWLEAWELTYEDQLMKMITSKQHTVSEQAQPALAQFVFCIDVRSEPFRRKLEQAGPFETFGTAGFFGLPIETRELGQKHGHNSLPVMFKPQVKIKETVPKLEFKQFVQRQQAANSLSSTFKTMKHNMLASLLLPEISGPWLSLQTLARSFVPRRAGNSFRKMREIWLRKPPTELTLEHMHTLETETELPIGFSEKEKAHYVRQALKMMGLTEKFAPLVVICGHGSHSTNNPYASALDCGACGGTSSGFNARVLAALCNLPNVRQTLATEGILIPHDTIFAAAEHVTTLDELRWLYIPKLSAAAQEAFDRLQATLPKVSEEANAERILQLPNIQPYLKNPKAEAQRFAEDWSELRPEWGLARNATFIIGDRKLTQACNLGGRAFLQNYSWQKDKTGTLLANIISGPATVTQWINLQYYASTVAPHYYGSGNKATQTVTAGIGVMQGNASDLLSGLPWQSVMKSDQEAYHAPLRLLVVVQAPKEYVERMLEHVPEFQQKVKNGWIRLASIDPEGHWESWS